MCGQCFRLLLLLLFWNLYVKFRSPKFLKFVRMGMEISNFNNYVWKNVFFRPLEVRESY